MQHGDLKSVIHLIGNGVFVISAEHGGQMRGFTATWVSQVSYLHRLIMLSASKEHDTYPLIADSQRFVVNVLGVSNVDIARHFGRKKAPDVPFDLRYFKRQNGAVSPVLSNAMAYIKCRVIATLDVRDHTIFVGEIEDAQVLREENPLLYFPKKGYVTKYEV